MTARIFIATGEGAYVVRRDAADPHTWDVLAWFRDADAARAWAPPPVATAVLSLPAPTTTAVDPAPAPAPPSDPVPPPAPAPSSAPPQPGPAVFRVAATVPAPALSTEARDRTLRAMWSTGATAKEIGAAIGVSGTRVYQLADQLGLPRRRPRVVAAESTPGVERGAPLPAPEPPAPEDAAIDEAAKVTKECAACGAAFSYPAAAKPRRYCPKCRN